MDPLMPALAGKDADKQAFENPGEAAGGRFPNRVQDVVPISGFAACFAISSSIGALAAIHESDHRDANFPVARSPLKFRHLV